MMHSVHSEGSAPKLRRVAAAAILACGCCACAAQNGFRPMPMVVDLLESSAPRLDAQVGTRAVEATAPNDAGESALTLRLLGEATAAAAAEIGGSGAEVEVQRAAWGVEVTGRTGAGRSLTGRFLTEFTFYDWSGAPALIPGTAKPFNDLYRSQLELGWRSDPEPGHGVGAFAGAGLELAGEDDIAGSSALVFGGAAGVSFTTLSENRVEFGIAGLSRLEDDPWFWPYLGLDVGIGERTRVHASGNDLRLEHELSPTWSVFAFTDWQVRQHRLNSSGAAPSGVFLDEEIRAGLGLRRRLGRDGRLDLYAGQSIWREFGLLDSDGLNLETQEADGAAFVGFALRIGL